MKILFLLIFFFIISCSGGKTVYWCGDHACISKKEKEAYFKKTMIVEKIEINDKNNSSNSLNQKILDQAKINEKNRIKNEKRILKLKKAEDKIKAKKQKQQRKKVKLIKKENVKSAKEKSKEKKKVMQANNENISTKFSSSSSFSEIKNYVIKKNKNKPFPNINDTQE